MEEDRTTDCENWEDKQVNTSLELTPHLWSRQAWTDTLYEDEWYTQTHTHQHTHPESAAGFKICSTQCPSSPCWRTPAAWTSHWDPSGTCDSAPWDKRKRIRWDLTQRSPTPSANAQFTWMFDLSCAESCVLCLRLEDCFHIPPPQEECFSPWISLYVYERRTFWQLVWRPTVIQLLSEIQCTFETMVPTNK